jgi:L-ascorbate metabolism protein UlaG (beta-lactamase superfamily)
MTTTRITHIGGPTALIEVGWRLLTDPTFDTPPGPPVQLRLGLRPTLSRPIAGDVIGFALGWDGQEHGALWITGDTVLYEGVRQVADRLQVDTALLHLGGVRFPVTGPVRYSMTAHEAVEPCRLVRPRTAILVHYEGWTHFRQRRAAIDKVFQQAPADIGRCLQWLPIKLFGQELSAWIAAVRAKGLPGLTAFADSLTSDLDAVTRG